MPSFLPPVNGVSFSQAYAEAINTARVDRVILPTYELRHASFTVPIRIVNDFNDLSAQLESTAPIGANTYVTFTALPIDITGPDESDATQTPTIKVTIDGVSGYLVQQLDLALATLIPVTITERIYVSDDLTGPCQTPVITMTLRNVIVSDTQVTGEAYFYDASNHGFPKQEYSVAQYPGLTAR